MAHVDPDDLALIALGERPSATDAAHLATCGACSAEVGSLADVVAVGRSVTADDAPVAPAPAVWERVRDELGLPRDLAPAAPHAGQARDAGSAPPADQAPGDVAVGVAAGAPDDSGSPALAPVVPLRRRLAPWVAAAAACGVVVGAAGGAWWTSRDTAAEPDVVAQVPLEPLPGWTATGSARVEEDATGALTLVVTLAGDGSDDGYREVWLIDRDVTRLVSLGVLAGAEGRFAVPPDLDLDQFPVVDVSAEPLDGDPAHSGDSILRGVLGA